MALDLKNLDEETRKYMIAEIQADSANGLVYYSKYLTHEGRMQWDRALLEAAQNHDSSWFAQQLRNEGLAVPMIPTPDRRGFMRRVRYPIENLADSEFNRYYMRGLCLRAIDEGIPHLITYRARPVRQPKSPVGIHIKPEVLLEDLRTHKKQTEHAIPSNPNSGISVMLP